MSITRDCINSVVSKKAAAKTAKVPLKKITRILKAIHIMFYFQLNEEQHMNIL